MNLNDCYNFEDFRKLAKKKLPAPIFHYIDGTISIEWGAYGVPESYLISDNNIIKKFIGPLNHEIIDEIKLLIK